MRDTEILLSTYKAMVQPIYEYVYITWSSIPSTPNITKLKTIQNTTTKYYHYTHLHLQLHVSQIKQDNKHPLYSLTNQITHDAKYVIINFIKQFQIYHTHQNTQKRRTYAQKNHTHYIQSLHTVTTYLSDRMIDTDR